MSMMMVGQRLLLYDHNKCDCSIFVGNFKLCFDWLFFS